MLQSFKNILLSFFSRFSFLCLFFLLPWTPKPSEFEDSEQHKGNLNKAVPAQRLPRSGRVCWASCTSHLSLVLSQLQHTVHHYPRNGTVPLRKPWLNFSRKQLHWYINSCSPGGAGGICEMKGTRSQFRPKYPLKFSMQPSASTCKNLSLAPLGQIHNKEETKINPWSIGQPRSWYLDNESDDANSTKRIVSIQGSGLASLTGCKTLCSFQITCCHLSLLLTSSIWPHAAL